MYLWMRQIYLVATAGLMALILVRYIPEWTVWVLLAALSIWDLIAVLCPKGPLKVPRPLGMDGPDLWGRY